MAIPSEFLQELTDRTDMLELVGSYAEIRRKGGRYWACCPFHNEKTPSFKVDPEEKRYHCFGCGKGGGVINFVMEAENLQFRDAVQFLADRAGLPMPEEEHKGAGRSYQKRERLLALNKEAARWFHSQLSTPQGAPMLRYLEQRALSRKTITSFGLGAAPEGWNNLLNAMAEKGYAREELVEAGLAIRSEKGSIYDRFRNRVMFPIIDLRGAVIGFGGRVLDNSTPKYLNSPETPVYNKSKNLFAMNLAKNSKQGRIILTEGYMDTIALHQGGFDCAVASLGTSLTEEHAHLLSRYTKEVIISYDGDGAGVKAAQRAIGILEKTGLNVRVLQVTGAKDPDEFIKKYGPEAFTRLLDRSGNHIEYRLQQLASGLDLTQDAERLKYVQEAAKLIASQPGQVEREIYSNRVAQQVNLTSAAVQNEVERARKILKGRSRKQEQRSAMNPIADRQPRDRALRYQNPRSASAEEEVLRLANHDPELLTKAQQQLGPEDFSSEFLGRVFSLFCEQLRTENRLNPFLLAEQMTQEEMSQLSRILERPVASGSAQKALEDCINVIQTEKIINSPDSGGDDQLLALRYKKRTEDKHS